MLAPNPAPLNPRLPWVAALLAAALVAGGPVLPGAGAAGQGATAERSGTTEAGVRWWSEGSGPGLVLIHAFSLDRRMWDPLVDELSGRFQIVRFDLRGHGASAPASAPYSGYLDLAEVMDGAGLDRATLVGLSSGSAVAADFALAFPDRVDRLVLASPSVSGYTPRGSFAWMAAVGEGMRAAGPAGAAEAWLETPLMALGEDAPGAELVRQIALDNAGVWALQPHPDQPPEPAAALRLGSLAVPTLVMVGARDLLDTRLVASLLDYCLPDRRVEVLPTGHLITAEAPGLFAAVLDTFLRQSPSGHEALSSPPPGCGQGEELMGPGSLAPLARLVGGVWSLDDSHQGFSWGVGRRSIRGDMYVGDDPSRTVSELMWYWHPEKGLIEGRGVAIEMGIDLFEYETRIEGEVVLHTLRAFGPSASEGPVVERWTFQDADSYLWELFPEAGGAEPMMDGLFRRVWPRPTPNL